MERRARPDGAHTRREHHRSLTLKISLTTRLAPRGSAAVAGIAYARIKADGAHDSLAEGKGRRQGEDKSYKPRRG